jgi:hypothetical protein
MPTTSWAWHEIEHPGVRSVSASSPDVSGVASEFGNGSDPGFRIPER